MKPKLRKDGSWDEVRREMGRKGKGKEKGKEKERGTRHQNLPTEEKGRRKEGRGGSLYGIYVPVTEGFGFDEI